MTPDSFVAGVSSRSAAVFVAIAALAGAVLGVAGGWVWSLVADPPSILLTDQGLIPQGESQYGQLTQITMWYIVVGVAAGLVAGLVIGWFGRRFGIVTVAATVTLCAVGATISAVVGERVFGPDTTAELASATVGDLVTTRLGVGTVVGYVAWPIGGLIGVLVAALRWSDRTPPETVAGSGTLAAHQPSTRDT